MASIGRVCYCGKLTKIRTSWTDANPARRFLGCENYEEGGGCGFFQWYDPPMCEHSVHVIPGLLRRVKSIEAENQRLKVKLRISRMAICIFYALVISTIIGVIFLPATGQKN